MNNGYALNDRTFHYENDNRNRENAIIANGGDGEVIAKFYWDRGHQNGAEWHYVTTNAIIIIVNVITNKVCTKLIARPQQLTRYLEMGMRNELNEKTMKMKNWIMPKSVIGLAMAHMRKGLNYA